MEQNQEAPPKTSGMAIASLILAVTCIGAPIAIILGIIALVQIAGNPRLRGQGLAIAGVILSVLALLVVPIVAAVSFPVFVRARERAQQTQCLNNVKQLAMTMQMYAADYNGYFPPTDRWNDTLKPYYKNPKVLVCPSDKTGGPSYGMNDRIGGISQRDVSSPAEVVSFFDSIPGPNKSDGPGLLPVPPRHIHEVNNVGFADGHAKAVADPNTLNWNPGVVPGTQPPP